MQNQELVTGLRLGSFIGLILSKILKKDDLLILYAIIFISFNFAKILFDLIFKKIIFNSDLILGIFLAIILPIFICYMEKY